MNLAGMRLASILKCDTMKTAQSEIAQPKSAQPMRYVAGVYRLVIAFFCIAGTNETWTFHKPANFVYFTHQTNILLGIVMLWAAIASFRGSKQPPAWLKGMLTLNILITGLVAGFILPPTDPATFVYLAFVLIRAQIWPNSGPEAGGNPYPYGFVNLKELGWAGLGMNIVIYMAAFCVAGLLLCLIDHVLPRRTPLTGCAPSDSSDPSDPTKQN